MTHLVGVTEGGTSMRVSVLARPTGWDEMGAASECLLSGVPAGWCGMTGRDP